MTVEVFDFQQYSTEWWQVRLGIPTASMFATVMASGRGGGESKTRRTYMLTLAGERLTGEPMEGYTNHHMERGKAMEAEARNFYAFMYDTEPMPVGFIRNGEAGCSPDSLLGDDGILEIKTALPHILIGHILADRTPPEHRAQVQGQLWVSERQFCDLVIYWPKLPLFIRRIERDEEYIAELGKAVAQFNRELDGIVGSLRQRDAS